MVELTEMVLINPLTFIALLPGGGGDTVPCEIYLNILVDRNRVKTVMFSY